MRDTSPETIPAWNLKQLYADEKALQKDLHTINVQTQKFVKYRPKLEKKPTRELVEQAMKMNEDMAVISHKIGTYSMLQFAQNTQDEDAKALQNRLTQFFTKMGNETLYFGLWWKNLDEKTARKLAPRNKEHAYALNEMRKYRKHLLSEKEEQIINLKDANGSDALVKLYEISTSGYTFPWKKGLKTIHISEEELRPHIHGKNPHDRVKAYNLLWKKFGEHAGELGEIYVDLSHNYWNEHVTLRKYETPISVRNKANNLDDEMVKNFLRVCEQNTDIFQEYMEWKMDLLHVPFSRYHTYAPLPHPNKKYTFQEGYQKVMSAYEDFSPRFKKEAHRVLSERRLDAQIRKGKRGGAFCANATPNETAFVLTNWNGKLQSVFTLAHELGHAVHDHLSGNHSIFLQQAGLPLAETASTFGEMLLAQKLMDENGHTMMRKYLLAQQLDEAYSTIQRQAFFCKFEIDAFDAIHEGKSVTELNELYYENLREQFGKKMHIPVEASYEWLMIPHIFEAPFYVYAYSFGQLLVTALWEMYQEEGKDFVPRYEKFLSYGGSKDPEKMLLEIGFDPWKKQSWQSGFNVLRSKLNTLKKMH